MRTKKPKHGGRRHGAGRKPKDEADRAQKLMLSLYRDEISRLHAMGHGTAQAAIRHLLAAAGIVQRPQVS